MPDKSSSFSYEPNGLIKQIDVDYYYDYYNRLVNRYQQQRIDKINKEGSFDDIQLMKERYLKETIYVSHTPPLSPSSLLFANRKNGYLAYTNEIPETSLDPIAGLDFLKVSTFFEYLSRVKGTAFEGFFYRENQLCCYAIIDDNIRVVTANGAIPLLFFAERFTYKENEYKTEGIIGRAVLSSPYFSDITLDIYSDDSLSYLDKFYIYAYTSENDINPVGKIPGEPIFKTVVINEFDDTIEKIKINDIELDATTPGIGTITGKDDRLFNQYIGAHYLGNGKFDIAFTLPYKDDPIDSLDFIVNLYINNSWSADITCRVYLTDNNFSSLTTILKIDGQEFYLDVPTEYTIRAQSRYFLDNYLTQTMTDLHYLDKKITVPLTYLKKEQNNYVFKTDSVTVPSEEGETPKDYAFVFINYYTGVNLFTVPIWCYGYTTGTINKVPDNFILVTPKLNSEFSYTEYEDKSYNIEFTWIGTLTLIDVNLKRVSDDYGYFKATDFSLEKVAVTEKLATYTLRLNKKIIESPKEITTIPLRILFNYTVQRKDLTQLKWPAQTFYATLELTYVVDRWEIVDITINNPLLGDAVLFYRIKDKLLDLYTDKYSEDNRLIPNGIMYFSSNVKKHNDIMEWDIRNKKWQSNVNVIEYGDISLQFKGVNSVSNIAILPHDKPKHPLTATPVITDMYEYVMGRVVINLMYNDVIESVYINNTLIGSVTPIKLDNVKGGYGFLSSIYNTTKTEIIGIGLDLIPIKQGNLPIELNFTGINDHSYDNWTLPSNFSIPVKAQREVVNFVFILGDDFQFGKESTGKLKLNNVLLDDAKIVAVVRNAANNVVVAKPNFNPIGNSEFDTINLYLEEYLSNQKEYYLDFEVFEYLNASKDNNLPYQLYYLARILFKVP